MWKKMLETYQKKTGHVHWGQKLALATAKKVRGLTSAELRAPLWLIINGKHFFYTAMKHFPCGKLPESYTGIKDVFECPT